MSQFPLAKQVCLFSTYPLEREREKNRDLKKLFSVFFFFLNETESSQKYASRAIFKGLKLTEIKLLPLSHMNPHQTISTFHLPALVQRHAL